MTDDSVLDHAINVIMNHGSNKLLDQDPEYNKNAGALIILGQMIDEFQLDIDYAMRTGNDDDVIYSTSKQDKLKLVYDELERN